jgi:MFS transporter, DHA3 family, macrolide efflux protein
MKPFVALLSGQTLSLLGTQLTGFGVSVWVFERTNSVSVWTVILFTGYVAALLSAPFAGTIVDHFHRRRVLLVSNLAGAAVIAALVTLYFTNTLAPWNFLITNAVSNCVLSVQEPALVVTATSLLPATQYVRGQGLISLSTSIANVAAPALGGALYAVFGLGTLLAIDVLSYGVAIVTVILVPIATASAKQRPTVPFARAIADGFAYARALRPLRFLLVLVFLTNLWLAFRLSLRTPLLLARTGRNEVILGQVQAIGTLGGVFAGVLLAAWGGPRRKVEMFVVGLFVAGLLGQCTIGVSRTMIGWSAGFFISTFAQPFINASGYTILQTKVPVEMQGRVIALTRFAAQAAVPLAVIASGPLADHVFEPAMRRNPPGLLRWLVGTGPGAGIGLLMVLTGAAAALTALVAWCVPAIRNIELDDWAVDLPIRDPVVAAASGLHAIERSERWDS